jgi:osmotically inducible protein OsmC
MPRIERTANVVWTGNVARGRGVISAGTGAFEGLEFSLPVRIGRGTEGKTSPEELLAAAHAGCFAMSLAGELQNADARIDVDANVIMDEVPGKGHRVIESRVSVRAHAPGVDRETFERAVQAAHEGCSFSQLIEASAKVTIDAELEG